MDGRTVGRAVGRTGVLGCGDSMSDLSQLSIENRLRKQERPSARTLTAGRGEEMMRDERTETNRRFKVGVKQGTPDKICSSGNFCSIEKLHRYKGFGLLRADPQNNGLYVA